jgi:REP element-mobilizing transposase RayT
MDQPLAFLITWTTYGTRLHGDERGSFDRIEGYVQPSERRQLAAEALMTDDPVYLTPEQRAAVDAVLVERCAIEGWLLHARNVRTNHVHVVVSVPIAGKLIRSRLKARTSAQLSDDAGLGPAPGKNGARRWWTEKGDIQPIWDERHLEAAIRYVNELQ